MKWVLDTTAFSALMQQKPGLITILKQYRPRDIGTVPPVVAEITYGIERLDHKSRKFMLLNSEKDRLLSLLSVLPWIPESSHQFGVIKADLEKRGMLIDDFDVTIAAVALSHQCGVITSNTSHFKRIKDLDCQSW